MTDEYPEVLYEGLTNEQRWIKRGILFAVRESVAIQKVSVTEKQIVDAVERFWKIYNE